MIQLSNVSLSFGDQKIFNNVNVSIHSHKKYALLGVNGSGKTTLFRLLTEELRPDSGTIQMPAGETVGYLPQDIVDVAHLTLWELVNQAFREVDVLKERVHLLEMKLAEESENQADIAVQIAESYDRLNWLNAHKTEGEIARILKGLGFRPEEFHNPLSQFSGGWRMRAWLAKLLLEDPDYLLLDEPTNHLDIESLQWLEGFLKGYPGTLIIITHDRYFVDRLTNRILYVENNSIREYPAPYQEFQKRRALTVEAWKKEWAAQQQYIKDTQKFIDRFRYKATKAKQVQSRIRDLEKLEKISPPPVEHSTVSLHFPISRNSYKDVFRISNITFAYDSQPIIKDLSLNIYRGEKIAVIGPNGAGKTTLLKILCGVLTPQSGEIRTGLNTDIGFYAQHQVEQLNLKNTIYEEVSAVASDVMRPLVRSLLGAFLFRDAEQEKIINVLSGGEKARVSLAKILVQPFNTLIMDEPTNHLDISSRDILLQALNEYPGTVIIVSHDRNFVDRFAQRTVYVNSAHEIREFPGNYTDFMKHFEGFEEEEVHFTPDVSPAKSISAPDAVNGELSYAERKELNRKKEKLSRRMKDLEQQIDEMSSKKEAISARLADPSRIPLSEIQTLSSEFDNLTDALNELNDEYIELLDELELIEARI